MAIFKHLYILGYILSAMDSFGIGSNDVANAFGTAVGSGTLTILQASLIAVFMEFGGAVLLGANVTDSIRGSILSVSLFKDVPGVLMLVMVSALLGSSIWTIFASKQGWPVSTTHSIIAGIVGGGVASFGWDAIYWGYGGNIGMASIMASWVISPVVAAAFGAIIYLLTYWVVLREKDTTKCFNRGLQMAPYWFAGTFALEALFIVWKGSPRLKLNRLAPWQVGTIVACVFVIVFLYTRFVIVDFLRRRIWEGENLRAWHLWISPLVRKQPLRKDFTTEHLTTAPALPVSTSATGLELVAVGAEKDAAMNASTSASRQAADDVTIVTAVPATGAPGDGAITVASPDGDDGDSTRKLAVTVDGSESTESNPAPTENEGEDSNAKTDDPASSSYMASWSDVRKRMEQQHWLMRGWTLLAWVMFSGVNQEVSSYLSHQQAAHHAEAIRHEGKVEELYSYLQVFTCMVASFAHGSNDIANSVGPFSVLVSVYETGAIPTSQSSVDVWVLAYGGAFIVVGLWFYGYKVMRALGNQITYHSPSRGFSMELGATLAVLTASKLGFPISTTHAITGATIGVGLCNGKLSAVNWRKVGFIALSWVATIPAPAIISGLVCAFSLYAPHF